MHGSLPPMDLDAGGGGLKHRNPRRRASDYSIRVCETKEANGKPVPGGWLGLHLTKPVDPLAIDGSFQACSRYIELIFEKESAAAVCPGCVSRVVLDRPGWH